MRSKRPISYKEAAEAVTNFIPADLVNLTPSDLTMILAQGEVIKLCASFARTRVETRCKKLVNKSKTVAAWVEADAAEVRCFAIEVSNDRGRTWKNPMQE